MYSKTTVQFMENFLQEAKKYFNDADLVDLAQHLARNPDDGIASDLSDRLRLIPWEVGEITGGKEIIIWFLVQDDLSSIEVIALDDDEMPDGENNDAAALEKLEQIARLLSRGYRFGERLQELLDIIGPQLGVYP